MDLTFLKIREINEFDYEKNYCKLLEQLTYVGNITKSDFLNFISHLNTQHKIFVIEYENEIIASGTIFIENKLIHNCSKVGHIEDIVVDNKYKGKNIGKKIIDFLKLYAKNLGCYKIILDCNENITHFYNKCGFDKKGNYMTYYY